MQIVYGSTFSYQSDDIAQLIGSHSCSAIFNVIVASITTLISSFAFTYHNQWLIFTCHILIPMMWSLLEMVIDRLGMLSEALW